MTYSLKVFLTSLLTLLCYSAHGLAETGIESPPTLEQLELTGTSRLSVDDVATELGLVPGTPISEGLVIKAREQLLSLGLFHAVSFFQQRGSKRGKVKLIIAVEDDEDVLSDWGLGGMVGLTHEEQQLPHQDPEAAPLGYRLELIARNLFKSMHRGLVYTDVDGRGVFREGKIIYGMPRFTREDAQFDVRLTAVDSQRRYLNAQGFGGRVEALWTRSKSGFDWQYGPVMYVNRSPRFSVGEFPRSAAGPKIALLKETRLMGFFPSAGYGLSGALVYTVTQPNHSMAELAGAYTLDLYKYVYVTIGAQLLTIGVEGYSLRGENRYDIPIGPGSDAAHQTANLFLRLRTGSDEYQSTHLLGSSATIGLRYHSPGFIAELAVEFTKAPTEYVDRDLERGGDKP